MEPFNDAQLRTILKQVLADGALIFTRHSREQMAQREVEEIDVVNVLRGGHLHQFDLERGTWRYQVRTQKITVVIAFPESEAAPQSCVIITAWRTSR